jgi:hypothetical protein
MQTHAIRLTVDGGGQVTAELVSVGHSGEQSPNRHPLSEACCGGQQIATRDQEAPRCSGVTLPSVIASCRPVAQSGPGAWDPQFTRMTTPKPPDRRRPGQQNKRGAWLERRERRGSGRARNAGVG